MSSSALEYPNKTYQSALGNSAALTGQMVLLHEWVFGGGGESVYSKNSHLMYASVYQEKNVMAVWW